MHHWQCNGLRFKLKWKFLPEESTILQLRWSSLSSEVGKLRSSTGRPRQVAHFDQLHSPGSFFPHPIWGYSSHRQYYMQNTKYHLIWELPLPLIHWNLSILSKLTKSLGEKKIIHDSSPLARDLKDEIFHPIPSMCSLGPWDEAFALLLCGIAKLLLKKASLRVNTPLNEWMV